jgi:hypothetical protein
MLGSPIDTIDTNFVGCGLATTGVLTELAGASVGAGFRGGDWRRSLSLLQQYETLGWIRAEQRIGLRNPCYVVSESGGSGPP